MLIAERLLQDRWDGCDCCKATFACGVAREMLCIHADTPESTSVILEDTGFLKKKDMGTCMWDIMQDVVIVLMQTSDVVSDDKHAGCGSRV